MTLPLEPSEDGRSEYAGLFPTRFAYFVYAVGSKTGSLCINGGIVVRDGLSLELGGKYADFINTALTQAHREGWNKGWNEAIEAVSKFIIDEYYPRTHASENSDIYIEVYEVAKRISDQIHSLRKEGA